MEKGAIYNPAPGIPGALGKALLHPFPVGRTLTASSGEVNLSLIGDGSKRGVQSKRQKSKGRKKGLVPILLQ